jgi:hypothetical protein
MPYDLGNVLWLGGAQWAGKSTVAQLLLARHPLVLYAYDYHDSRSHADRARAAPDRFPHRAAFLEALERDPDSVWVQPTPEAMAQSALLSFAERFEMVLDDLRALPPGVPILAEGWGLRPDLLAPYLSAPERAVFLVPTPAFVQQQVRTLPRAAKVAAPVRNPARAQANRLARDGLLADDVVTRAAAYGLRVVHIDGTCSAAAEVAAEVEAQFRPFLPAWLY